MRIVLADYYQVVRVGLRVVLEQQGDIHVVGEAGSAQAAVDLVIAKQPDIVVFDLNFPDAAGLAIVRTLLVAAPQIRLLLLTANDEPHLVRKALAAGVHGCLTKTAEPAEMVRAVRSLAAGRSFISVPLARGASSFPPAEAPAPASTTPSAGRPLSKREQQVLELFAEGRTLRQVADILGVRAKTVETYRSRLGDKFRVRSRAELVVSAREMGLLPMQPTPAE
jgi:DNA-binding NarL/FixJ family response regulator